MPFDFNAYDQKCNGLTVEELQREWEHYTRLISGAATSTAVSGVAIPFTLGISTIGVAMAAPAIHNARKKREIVERHLNKFNATHHTRKRDVLGSMAVSGTIGVVTLGVSSFGADAIATAGAEHGIQAVVANETAIKIATHAALDGAGLAAEHAHTDHLKKKDAFKAFKKAGVFKAVKDAKAAEAGYAYGAQPIPSPYNNQGYAYPYTAASGSSQALPMPPPPYSPATAPTTYQQPGYSTTQNGYPQDFKAPITLASAPQLNYNSAFVTPSTQDHYGYTPQQQIPRPSDLSNHPMYAQVSSPPQTPMAGYSPHVMQGQEQARENTQSPMMPMYQPQTHEPPSFTQTPVIAPYSPTTASSGSFNMSSLSETLPSQTTTYQHQQPQFQPFPGAALPTPPQDNKQNEVHTYLPTQSSISTPTPEYSNPAPPTGYFPSVSASPNTTSYPPPPVTLSPHSTPQPSQPPSVQITQQPQYHQSPSPYPVPHYTGPSQQPQHHQSPVSYAPPQHTTLSQQPQYPQSPSPYPVSQYTGPSQQAQVLSPPPPSTYPQHTDSKSAITALPQSFTPHAAYNPQDYGPISPQQQQQGTAISSYGGIGGNTQVSQVTQNHAYYQVPHPSQPPMGTYVPQY